MGATEELAAVGAPARVLGRYRLRERLGSGGFGTVYAGHDERLDRPVAVKVIPAGGPASERVHREALAAARLDHPAIVAVFDAGEDAHARYLVSELVRGATLDRLAARGELSDRDVLRVGLALADGLQHAHERGVVHRDVKPQNVIVPDAASPPGVAKLADFGVAHLAGDEPLTQTGDVVGTLAYMAPEQAAGRRVDARADLYALALVLYEALAGINPVRADGPAATARRVGSVLPPLRRARRDVPEELGAAIDRALRPRPEERGTLAELAQALAAALPLVSDAGGTVAPHPLERTGVPPLPTWAARAGGGVLAAAGLTAAFAAAPATAPLPPAVAGALAAAAVALLPRLGWLLAAAAAIAVLAGPLPGAAVLVAAACAPVPPLLRRHPRVWPLPLLAPALGLAALAAAYPAIAGRAPRATARAALGALGAWTLSAAEPLLQRTLLGGPPDGLPPRGAWLADAGSAAQGVLAALLSPAVAACALVWALAAAALPWVVRGRWAALDVVGASAWAAGLTSGTAVALAPAAPRGVVPGAVAAAVAALAGPRLLRRAARG